MLTEIQKVNGVSADLVRQKEKPTATSCTVRIEYVARDSLQAATNHYHLNGRQRDSDDEPKGHFEYHAGLTDEVFPVSASDISGWLIM